MSADTMQVMMFTDFNRMALQSVALPALQHADDVLIRVRAAGVCGSDLHGYTGKSGRRKPPLVMGHEVSGEVVAVGSAAGAVQVGQRVAVQPLVYRPNPETGQIQRKLIGMDMPGAYAEYVVAPAKNLYPMPADLPYLHGALTEPLAVAVHAVSRVHVRPYDSVFIVGAGAIGLLVMQVLLNSGVRQVIMSDVSDARLAIARDMGASVMLNPQRDNVREAVRQLTDGHGCDVTFEAVGIAPAVAQSIEAVRDGGQVVWVGNNVRVVDVDMQAVVTRELRVIGTYGMNEEDFRRALGMLANKRIDANALVNRQATLNEGETLFDELLAAPEIIKCVITF